MKTSGLTIGQLIQTLARLDNQWRPVVDSKDKPITTIGDYGAYIKIEHLKIKAGPAK